MNLKIASAEIISIFFMLIIFGSICNKDEEKGTDQRAFFAFTLSTILGLFFDAFSYIADEMRINSFLMIIVNVMAFSVIHVCITLYSLYMILIIRHTKNITFRPVYPIWIFSAINIIWIILGVCNGMFFTVKDNHIQYGPWEGIITIMPIISVTVVVMILAQHVKSLSRRVALALGSFALFPLTAAVLYFVLPDLTLAYPATALSCAVIYTYIRREEIFEAHIREQIVSEISAKDSLTGLLNRRGFNEVIEKACDHESIGVVFCDLNALKYTNDNFGHEAGDAYIQRFADILRKEFGDLGSICRISGDEFIVLLYDILKDKFDELKEKLNSAIMKADRIASVGYAYGGDTSAMELIRSAEQEMYNDKNRYYAETGLDRRRSGRR